jgi:hypothetical protein
VLKFLRWSVSVVILISVLCAFAQHNFCCSGSNLQQDMFNDFNTRDHGMDLSFPPGIFRAACSHCAYDLKTVRCDCENDVGEMLHNTELKVGDCQNIYDDIRGNLRCGS